MHESFDDANVISDSADSLISVQDFVGRGDGLISSVWRVEFLSLRLIVIAQATAFGLKSVVGVPGLEMDVVGALSSFCEKASTVRNGETSLFMCTMKLRSQSLVPLFAEYCLMQCSVAMDLVMAMKHGYQ